jgi:nucleoside-diphosphate-sugar epimerase
VRHAPPRPGDIIHSHADVARARELLGYEPGVRFEKGIGRTVEYFNGPPLEKEVAQ